MRTTIVLSLCALSFALPAAAQEREERVERRVETRAPGMRILEATRAPRGVLGISSAVGGGLADTAGVLVQDVLENGPAARAGVQRGARLTEIDGVSLRISRADAADPLLATIGSRRLTRELSRRNPGDEVQLRVTANGQSRTVRVRLADADSLLPRRASATGLPGSAGTLLRERMAERASLGIQVGGAPSPRDTLGVFVVGVDEGGPAAQAGIIEGTRIAAIDAVDLRVNRADLEDPMIGTARARQLTRALADVKPGEEVTLRVWQNGQYRTVRVRTVRADSLRRSGRSVIIGDAPFATPLPPGAVRRPLALLRPDVDTRIVRQRAPEMPAAREALRARTRWH